MQHPTERKDIVEDHAVGHQMVVFNDLSLLVTIIGQDRSITTERRLCVKSIFWCNYGSLSPGGVAAREA